MVEDDIYITESDLLVDYKIENNCYIDNTFIGATACKKITVNLISDNTIDLEGKTIKVYTGTKNEENIEYILQGNFIIDKPTTEEVTNKTSFTGYDYMIKFNTPYEDKNTYPISLFDFLQNLCNKVGVELENNNIVNGDYMIQGNPFTNNETNKFVLSQICQISAGFAQITNINKVKVQNLVQNEKLDTLDGNVYSSFSKNKKYGKINSVTLNLSDIQGEEDNLKDQTSIDENGLTEVVISNNYFLNSAVERQKVIQAIFDTLNGIEYLPFEMEYYGFPYLELGDGIEVLDNEDNPFLTYILNYTFTYNGSYSGALKTESNGEIQQKYNQIGTTKSKLQKVERSVDKINGKILDIVEIQDEHESKIIKAEQDINGLKQEVNNVLEFQRTVTGQNQIVLEDTSDLSDTILKIQITGTMTYLYPNTTLFPSTTLYPIGQYINLVIDKQEKGNMSDEAKKIKIVLLQPLRYMSESVYDEILIEDGICKIIRRVKLDSEGNFVALENEEISEIGNISIPSFKGNTYIYVLEHNGLNYNVDYLVDNAYIDTFATKVELNTKITQTETGIMSEVNKKVGEDEFGTLVEQNAEAVKYAWNQFSQYLQMEIINGKASLAIRDIKGNLLMSLDQDGQHFYIKKDELDKNIAETILVELTQNNDTKKSLMFVLDNIEMDGEGIMAWGYKANDKIYPVLYIGNFGDEEFGLHVINDLILSGSALKFANSSIEDDGLSLYLRIAGALKIMDSQNNNWIMQVFKDYETYGFSTKSDEFAILNSAGDKAYISFYDNETGGKTLNIFDNTFFANKIYSDNITDMNNCNWFNLTSAGSGDLTLGTKDTNVNLHFEPAWTSDARLKENIETSDIDSLKLINAIQHYSFDWKKDGKHEKIGYIAQELEKIDENLVKKYEVKDENNNVVDYDYAINEKYIIANLTNAIQQQQEQIDYLYEQLKIKKKNNKKKREKVKFEYGEKIKVKITSKFDEIKKKFEKKKFEKKKEK